MDDFKWLFVITAIVILTVCSIYIGITFSGISQRYDADRTAIECTRLPTTGVPQWLANDCKRLLKP